ncbi:MAG TPA: fused MFS/spermidine synthase [bacterium]|nr:fused MFS/spermidine synthase [bacterium]
MALPLWLAGAVTFTSGAAIMVIEIAGMKLLAPAFGSSFHVWTGQIGVVMLALAAGYWLGGLLIDRRPHARTLAVLLVLGGLATVALPKYTPTVASAIADRHYAAVDEDAEYVPGQDMVEIPPLWQKLDPMLGSLAAFFLPCVLLAGISPGVVRLLSEGQATAGAGAGRVLAFGTVGSLAGVFATAYWLVDAYPLPTILIGTGITLLTVGLLVGLLHRPVQVAP